MLLPLGSPSSPSVSQLLLAGSLLAAGCSSPSSGSKDGSDTDSGSTAPSTDGTTGSASTSGTGDPDATTSAGATTGSTGPGTGSTGGTDGGTSAGTGFATDSGSTSNGDTSTSGGGSSSGGSSGTGGSTGGLSEAEWSVCFAEESFDCDSKCLGLGYSACSDQCDGGAMLLFSSYLSCQSFTTNYPAMGCSDGVVTNVDAGVRARCCCVP